MIADTLSLENQSDLPKGAEILDDDDQFYIPMLKLKIRFCLGRAHLIACSDDGSAADHAGPDATKYPGFGPLKEKKNVPAIQIRQMGTLPQLYLRRTLLHTV